MAKDCPRCNLVNPDSAELCDCGFPFRVCQSRIESPEAIAALQAILGVGRRTVDEVNRELGRGGRFVVFIYCISFVKFTLTRKSEPLFVPAGEAAFLHRFIPTGISLLAGWWAIPWGPVRTLEAVSTNLRGGLDKTADVVATLNDKFPARKDPFRLA